MSGPAIEIRNITKRFAINQEVQDTLGGSIGARIYKFLRPVADNDLKKSICALNKVSFDVSAGEVLGIVGPNGAGKSTLLKILSKITSPDEGRVKIKGRVASLLQVGTGFHPDLTGRENIYFNGTLLGMRKTEVEEKLDEIIEFSGVGDFINTPIKKYSSGMKMRMAFSVAAHLDAEIMILDEVLAVGDANFQQKCLAKMQEVVDSGRTILFVSHNMAAIKKLCKRSIYLKHGKLLADGPTQDVIKQYLSEHINESAELDAEDLAGVMERGPHSTNFSMQLHKVLLSDKGLEVKRSFFSDEEIKIGLEVEVKEAVEDMRLIISLVDENNDAILTSQINDSMGGMQGLSVGKGIYKTICTIPANLLGEAEFYLTVELLNTGIEHLVYKKALSFIVNFAGYDKARASAFDNAYLRPKFDWDVTVVKGKILNDNS